MSLNVSDLLLASAQIALQPWAKNFATPEVNRLDAELPPTDLLSAVSALAIIRWGYLAAITGLDLGLGANAFEVLYHFCSGPIVVSLRVRLPREAAAIPSLCGLIPSASLFERELAEMLGIVIQGAPDTRPLYLPDDWPSDVYPLRKDAALPENNHVHP